MPPAPRSPTHYDVLGVTATASADVIRRAWREQVLAHHPDRVASRGPSAVAAAQERLVHINEAWRVLSDERARATYDWAIGVRSRAAPPRDDDLDFVDHLADDFDPAGRRPADDFDFVHHLADDPAYNHAYGRAYNHADGDDLVDVFPGGAHAPRVRGAGWLLIGAILLAIFVFTAYAGGGSGDPDRGPGGSFPGAEIGVLAPGDCVVLRVGNEVVPAPCATGGAFIVGQIVRPTEPCENLGHLRIDAANFERTTFCLLQR